jgi:Cft2 family RNA processing exonuclease
MNLLQTRDEDYQVSPNRSTRTCEKNRRIIHSMLEWSEDLKIRETSLYLDSRRPRPCCFVSHAHSDHIGCHTHAIATAPTAALGGYRIGWVDVTQLEYGKPFNLDQDTIIELQPAGHVFGSAMIHVTRAEGSLLYTGDFKLRQCLTVQCAEPVPADVLVMESTFGQPLFKFPPWRQVVDQLVDLVEEALCAGRQPIVMGYSLGKAQEIVRILNDAGFNVTVHGAVAAMCRIYEQFNVPLGKYRRYSPTDFHGSRPMDLRERGVLVAPPNVARSAFTSRFHNPLRIMLSGWGMLPNAKYRYGVDYVLPLSDHADFNELLELVERVQPKKIYTHHGYKEFAETLRRKGHDATLARPEAQLSLFE